MNILKTTELHTLKGQILCELYINKPIIKVFLNKSLVWQCDTINQNSIIKSNSEQDSSENIEYDSVCYRISI